MPYQHIEDILSRKGEKIAMFLTIENAVGLILAAFPAYLATAALPFLLRVLIVALAGAIGIIATLDVGGMALYERIAWRVRGELRCRVQPAPITPERLVGAAAALRRDRPLPVGGPVQLRPDGGFSRRRTTSAGVADLAGEVAARLATDSRPEADGAERNAPF
jgi:hypothetical protein